MKKLLTILGLLLFIAGCKKPFDPPDALVDDSILVVEGTIAVGENAENIFKLSRLRPLQADPSGSLENNADVKIVASGGSSWQLPASNDGIYRAHLNLPANDSYKIVIQTTKGDQYESPFQQAIQTPEIDSVTMRPSDQVDLFVHTHDPSNSTHYYRWQFIETWEYNAWYESTLDFRNGQILGRTPEEQVFTCWRSDSSESINIANSTALTQDLISYQPLTTITQSNALDRSKLTVRYSILVKQLGLTKEAYNFWNILKKNTELTGTLFDPQPSKMPSNIQCISDPKKESIGFVSVGRITTKRLFIRHSEVPLWPSADESETCNLPSYDVSEAIDYLKTDPYYKPVTYVERTNNSKVYLTNSSCMDCRTRGGKNVKPEFW